MEFQATIEQISDEARDVKSFRLTRPRGFTFIAGQYCLIGMPGTFDDEMRPFTLAESPDQPFLSFTIKRMGAFTTGLHALKAGDILALSGPQGTELNFDESMKEDIVFIAGGSGITPFMSALRFVRGRGLRKRLVLLYSNRTREDIIFYQELQAMNGKVATIIHTLTNGVPDGWPGESGYISQEIIAKYIPGPADWLWYLCGPPPMIASVEKILGAMKIPSDRLRIEPWQLPGKVHS
jgi:glycine betaine catabolism B